MFGKPAVRTYARKGTGAHLTTGTANTIIREAVPPDKRVQSKDLFDLETDGGSMDEDPFDTTFDRLLKTAKMPPKPPSPSTESSYAESSCDEEKSKDDSPLPLPPMIDEPLPEKRRHVKREKSDVNDVTIATGQITRAFKPRRPAKVRSISEMNIEPNIEPSATAKGTKRDGDRAAGSREKTAKRRSVSKRTSRASHRGRKQINRGGSRDDNANLTRPSVVLTRLESLDRSTSSENFPSDLYNNENSDEIENVTSSRSSKIGETKDESFVTKEVSSVEEFVDKPTSFVESISSPELPKRSGLSTNPPLRPDRWSVPQRFAVADKSWTNSTPIDRRASNRKTITKKARLRLSPIDASSSTRTRVRLVDENSSRASLSPKSPVEADESITAKSTNPKNSRPSSVTDVDEKSNEHREIVSSDSPLFDDSETTDERSHTEDSSIGEEKVKDTTDASTMSPFKGFSAESSDPESLQLRYEAADRSESSNENISLSVEKTNSAARTTAEPSRMAEEIDGGTVKNASTTIEEFTKDWSDEKLIKNWSDKESPIFTLNADESPSKNVHRSIENVQSVSHSTAPSENTAEITDASTSEQIGEFPDDSRNSTADSSTGNSKNFHSYDESSSVFGSPDANGDVSFDKNIFAESTSDISGSWRRRTVAQLNSDNDVSSSESGTVHVSPNASTDDSVDKNISAESSLKVSESRRRRIVVQLNSDDEVSSTDGLSEFVNVHEAFTSDAEADTGSGERANISDEKSSIIEDTNGNESEEAPEEEFRESGRRYRGKPIVRLERLALPVGKSRNIGWSKNAKFRKPSDSTESNQDFTSSPANNRVSEKSLVPARRSRRLSRVEKTIPARFSDRIKSSRNSTSSSAGNNAPTETPLPAKKSKRPSKVEKTLKSEKTVVARSSDKIELSQKSTSSSADNSAPTIETPVSAQKSKKSSDSLELFGKSAASEESLTERSLQADKQPEVDEKKSTSKKLSTTEQRRIDSHEHSENRFVDPVVLLTQLNDPVRVSLRRRQKYSDMNRQLTAIAENIEGPSPTIEEAPEENAISESHRSTLNVRPSSVKLSGEEINSQRTTVSVDSSISSTTVSQIKQLFLIPGKSWARSLSILSSVHSQEDLEALAIGKGKKWRQSVANVFQMQQGILQSCVKKNEDDKESRSFYGVRNSTAAWNARNSQSDASRLLGAASPERFVRRVSIRVVPDGTSLDRIEDSPFLEAYGITPSQNLQKISKRSSSIVPRKTLVYNVQGVTYDEIPRGINSATSRDVVLKQCGQATSLPFDECYPLSYLKHCRKIGEGVYGEVFLYENGDEKNVIKIIPIEGEMNVNNERQKKFDEILSEIVIAKELHNLRYADSSSTSSFVEVKNVRCVVGKYPRKLIELWRTYDDEKNSENDCPVMFDKNQLYIVLELGHGGQDLEAFVFQNASESLALFMQAAFALAVAEVKLDFEHRDLHWGNILISRTEESHIEYKLRDDVVMLASKGVKISVIDFTLSRMSYQGCSIYNDLSMDEDLFSAQGEYQFEIYRLMRKKVENDWQRFEPYTNVLWLHYTLDKMITAVRYRRKNSKIHNASIEKLRELQDTILNYKSAFDFVTNCDKAT